MNIQNEKMAGQKEHAPPSTNGEIKEADLGSKNFSINNNVGQATTSQGGIQYKTLKMESLPKLK